MESESDTFDGAAAIGAFLEATAARRPTPGGGSVTALVGALAAAIGQMTLNYSVGKKTAADLAAGLKSAIAELSRARELLLQLMVEDQLAYAALSRLHKQPEGSPDRVQSLAAAVKTCIRVPQAIGVTGLAVLELCGQAANDANPRLLSDLAIAAELAMATVRCAGYNCRTNLPEVEDAGERRQIDGEVAQMLRRATVLIQQVIPRIMALAAAQNAPLPGS